MAVEGRLDRCARWFGVLLGCTSLCPASIAAADGAPKATLTLPIAQRCRGACSPSIVPLQNGNAMVTWSSAELAFWAQAVDVQHGRLLGGPVELGALRTAARPLYQPLTVGLPGGDLAVLGVLENGRITFTRGSEDPARRVAPRVVVTASELEVLDVGATASGDGVTLLVLRGPHLEDLSAPRGPMDAELHWLDARGEALRAPMRWKAAAGSTPRLATCGGRLYIAWQGNAGVVVTSVSTNFDRAPEQTFRYARGVASELGPLVCSEGGARLFSSWRNSSMSPDLAPALKTIDIPAEAAKGTKPGSWQSVKLSAPPYVANRRVDVFARESGVQLVVQNEAATKLVTIAALKDARVTQQLNVPRSPTCLPLPSGTQAICTELERHPPDDPTCPKPSVSIKLGFYGQPALPPAANSKTYDYWASGPIPDARAPAAWTLELERALVRCTAPEFQGLRDALSAFCTNPATKPTEGQGYRAYCERTEPASLLSQAINCSDTTTKCGPVPLARVPAVDRAEYESGKRVELNYMNCSVWFSRDPKGWRVVDRECAGD